MTLRRGHVAACRHAVGVVWSVTGDEMVLLPIGRAGRPSRRADVALNAGILSRGMVIHCDMPVTVPIEGRRMLGDLPGAVVCRVSQAVTRAAIEAAALRRWADDTRHQAHVRLVTTG